MKHHLSLISPAFARDFLSQCGNSSPTDAQISFVKKTLSWVLISPEAKILSERERTFIFWISQGYSLEEISLLMRIKITTIQTYSKRAKRKLNCTSLAQVVFKAICLKTIPVENSESEFKNFLNNTIYPK